ncbi:MAG: glycosyltransferase family 4 protein [Deltaproteobacteria bacterium]|nr:MAG: glycosyltransferase family 4 protein [Deltaproteobacteria bacterium]
MGPVRADRLGSPVRSPLRGAQPRARGARAARRGGTDRFDGIHLRLSLVRLEGAQRGARRGGARVAGGAPRLPRLPDVLRVLDELVPVRALRVCHLLPGVDEARAAGDGVNEPIGVLRLVDPFRAADLWVRVAPAGYRVSVQQIWWPPRAKDVPRIAAGAARDGARIIHAHGRWANLLAVPAARAVRAKVVCTRGQGSMLAESLVIRAADAVMCTSHEERDRCVRREAICAAKVCVVHPGVDLSRFPVRAPEPKPLLVAVAAL